MPESPIARFGLALVGLLLLVLSFFVGIVFLAVGAGLAVLGGVALSVRRWWLRRKGEPRHDDEDLVEVEYRVVDRRRDP
ncbi:hypothetical protein [Halomonas denitrificans]|nr:hypothetical protein [Halomonas denitrificans]